MARSSAFFLLLSSLFQHSIASPVHLQQRDGNHSYASTLVVTPTAGDLPVVTFYPSRVFDPSLWTLSTPTTIISPSSTEVVGPLGYEWVASPSPPFAPPAIRTDAPYPRPGNIITVPNASSVVTRLSTGPGTGVKITPSSSVPPGIGLSSVRPPFPSTSSVVAVPPVSSSSTPLGTGVSFSGSIPLGTGISSSTILPPTGVTSSSTPFESGVGPSSATPPTGVSSGSIFPPTGISSSPSVPFGTGVSSSPFALPSGISSGSIFPPTGISSSPSVPFSTGVSPSSIAAPTGISSSSISLGTGFTSSNPLPPSSTSSTGPSGAPASSSASGDSSAPSSGASALISGTWSATPTEPTEAFPSYDAPTGVITGAAVTSEAAQLSGLFFAIYANRNRITDSNLKQEYIDDVRKTKEETDSLFNALDVKPDPNPDCSNTKRKRYAISERRLRRLIAKRSLISGITDLVGDAVKLLSCATKVVDNLVKAVEAPVPPIAEIETLTNALNEIAEDLEKEDKNTSNSPSESPPSSTQTSTASSSASSCTVSSAVPRCTETVTLSTSFFSGTTGSSTVQSITTEVCNTITTCGESASTAFTTVSTATSTTGIVCATDCAACANPIVRRDNLLYQRELLGKRSLPDPDDFDSANQYVLDQIETFDGVQELDHKQTGRLSSALSKPFEKEPMRLYVAGLFGCTSVVIISERGVWFSHHWEAPSFEGDDARFEREVLSTIRDGDPDDLTRMPSPFPLAQGGEILDPKSNVQIFISTPKNPGDGREIFETRVDKIVDLLTGEGKPWSGITPTRRGYLKPTSERERDQFAKRANSKVLIEYDNNQEAPVDEEPKPNQQAIYRVWLEQQNFEHQWDAIADVQKDAACSNPNRKRQDGGSCTQPAASSRASGASTVPTASPSGASITAAPPLSSGGSSGPLSSSSTEPPLSSTNISPSTTNPPASTTAASTTAPLGSDSATCSPTTNDAPSLPSGDIIGEVEPFCERINGKKISVTDYNYNDTSSWSGSDDSVLGLALKINWEDDCFGDVTIQSQDCKDTFQKVVDDCEPKTAPSGWLLQKYGGDILGFACVKYGVEIINGNVFDPATSPIAPPEASSTAPTPTPPTTTEASPPPPTATQPPPPDMSSQVCIDCTDSLGASDCSADDGQCLVNQCNSDKNCQACRIDCSTFG